VEQQFAEAYGWTPSQVASLPLDFYMWDPVIRQAKHRVHEMKVAQARREQRFGR